MKFRIVAASVALAAVCVPASATAQDQDAGDGAAQEATDVLEEPEVVAPTNYLADTSTTSPAVLRSNTPVEMTLNAPLSTKTNRTGDKFSLTVARDVMVDGRVAIPKGTRAIGLVSYAKGNGSFGKSGKMELAFKYLEMGDKQIPLEGTYYQEGEGNTAGTVGAVFAAGVIGGLVVKGKSAEIVGGKDFTAMILSDVPLMATGGSLAVEPGFTPDPVSMKTETEKERKKRLKALEKAQKG